MSPERWQQIKGVFHRATELDQTERGAFLAEACATDPSLLAEVAALLDCDAERLSWVSKPVFEAAPELLASQPAASRLGQRLGVYRIVSEIGRGGMGAVYLARRDDGEYEERVAIKVVKRGLDTDAVVARFRRERQILAHLDHPHIARLLDGGMTPDGLPYLVMEPIEGVPIDRYCAAERLSVTRRLELFRQVCAAVSCAHRNLVVHRDLKPSNILVTAAGVPKLLDFGVAKLLDPGEEGEGLTATAAELAWMTPEYASPEQVRGAPITTASDVYSLGVVLYEILAGRRPYSFVSRRRQEIERKVCEEEPTRPSIAVRDLQTTGSGDGSSAIAESGGELRKLRRRLAGDPDRIVLKALAKDPARRYGSVEQLSEDLRRHLEGLPVLARRQTVAYRTSRFLRRHWLEAAAAAVIVASLLVGIVTTKIQQRRAETVRDLLESVIKVSDPSEVTDRADLAGQLLERATREVREKLENQPADRARLLNIIGVTYRSLGSYDKAGELLEEAVRIRTSLDEDPADIAESLTELGYLRFREGELDEAEAFLERGWELNRRAYGEKHPAIANSLTNLGLVYWERYGLERREENPEEAEEYLARAEQYHRRALEMRRELLGDEHPDVAYSLNNLALVYRIRGELDKARELLVEALELRQEHQPENHPAIANALSSLARVLAGKGDYVQAERLYRKALALRQGVLPEEHSDLATNLNNLAGVLYEQAKQPQQDENKKEAWLAEATRLFKQALEINRHALGETHERVIRGHRNLGILLFRQERYEEAEPLFRKYIDLMGRVNTRDHPMRLRVMEEFLAALLRKQGREDEADEMEREVEKLRREAIRSQ